MKCKNHRVYCKRFTLVEASLVAHMVQNLPAMQETRLRSLGQGDFSWRREWQPTPSILAWEIPWTEKHGGLQTVGSQSTLEEAKCPPDTWAPASLPAGLCCPPDGHKPRDSTPASHKVLIK